MDKLIMKFKIFIDEAQNSDMRSPYGSVTMIPFTGKAESELFTGETLPGAVDVQIENPAGCRNMCAKYMFRGKDSTGADCQLFVENNAYFSKENSSDPFIKACPRFLTDSPTLGAYLCQSRFRAEVQVMDWGVEIRIYDVLG